MAGEIDRALGFMKACGANPEEFHRVDFYSGHEGLSLDYERALSRIDSRTGLLYDVSAPLRLDRRADPPARRCARRLRVPDPQPDRRQDRPVGGSGRGGGTGAAAGSRPGSRPPHADHPDGRGEGARPAAGHHRQGHGRRPCRWCGCATRCTATPGPPRPGTRRGRSPTSWTRSPGSSRSTTRLGTHPGGLHVELTGDDVTECVGRHRGRRRGRPARAVRDRLRSAPQPGPVARTGLPGRRDAAGDACAVLDTPFGPLTVGGSRGAVVASGFRPPRAQESTGAADDERVARRGGKCGRANGPAASTSARWTGFR